MAVKNLIQRSEMQRRIVRSLNIKERSAAPTLDTKITPVIVVDDLTAETSFQQASSIRACGMYTSSGPIAGQVAVIGLVNPATSGVVLRVTKARIQNSVADSVRIGFVADQGYPQSTGVFRDHRLQGVPSGVVQFTTQAAGLINPILQRISTFTLYDFLDMDMIIDPGFGLYFEQEIVNHNMILNLFWQEQFVDP